MKKLGLLVAILFVATSLFAYDFYVDGLCYNITSDVAPYTVEVAKADYSHLTNVVIPETVSTNGKTYTVTSIARRAFDGCETIEYVTLPSTITTIRRMTFSRCSSLIGVTIPASVTTIEMSAFAFCNKLLAVDIPNGVTTIESAAFYDCMRLLKVTVPASVKTIGNSAFANCRALKWLVVDEGNTVFDSRNNCNAIIETTTNTLIVGCKTTIIPSTVTSIGNNAFGGSTCLTSITIPDNVTNIGTNAFLGVHNIIYHGTATGAPWGANNMNKYAEGYIIYENADKKLLLGCSIEAMGEIIIPETVTDIQKAAFINCEYITSISVPNGVRVINDSVFLNCSRLASVSIGTGVESIGDASFANCKNLESVTIPQNVHSIGRYAFCNCAALAFIDIPNGVTSIGNNAFAWCTSLLSVVMPDKLTTIDWNTFYHCINLNSVTIPNSVTSIGNCAFWNCKNLTSITIPHSVTNIAEYAFYECTGLKSINSRAAMPPVCGERAFDKVASDIALYVPCGSIDTYQFAEEWKMFSNWLERPDYTINMLSNNTEWGTVQLQSYGCDGIATIIAIPNKGCRFVQWSDGDTENPRSEIVTGNISYTAIFKVATILYSIVTECDAEHGSVTGGGQYQEYETITLTAIPNKGYRFVRWNDGNTDNPRRVIATENVTYSAIFEQIYYTITTKCKETEGIVVGGGQYAEDEEITLTAIPNEGYKFKCWTDRNTDNPRTIVVICDKSYTAVFEKLYFTITTECDAEHGSITGGGAYQEGSIITLTAIPNENYTFLCWDDGNTDNPRSVVVREDITYKAFFNEYTGVDDVATETPVVEKFIQDGQVLIRRGDRVYTVTGQEVKK